MFTTMVSTLMLSLHSLTVCGGIGVLVLSVWVGAGDIPVTTVGTVLIGDPDGAGAPAGVGDGLPVGIIMVGMILGMVAVTGMVVVIGLIMFIIITEDRCMTDRIQRVVVPLHLIITTVEVRVR